MAKASRGKPPKPPKPTTPPPTLPKITGFTAEVSPTGIHLHWDVFIGATSYWIHRDAYVPAIVQDTVYIDASVTKGVTYVYYIRGVVNGVIGAQSDSITIKF